MKSQRQSPLRNGDRDDVRLHRRKIDRPALTRAQKKALLDYFARRLKRLKVVQTTRTPSGQILDWVPVESQVRGRKIATPPPAPRLKDPRKGFFKARLARFELEQPNAVLGAKGTVPILRKDVKRLRFNKSLEEYLAKYGGKSRQLLLDGKFGIQQPEDGGPHDYAFTGQGVTCYGCEFSISAYDPYTMESDEFSLGQVALSRVPESGGKQTLEAGNQEYRDMYGDWVPHFFIYYTTNGYSKDGDNQGGYNRDVDGWVQYSNIIYPGAVFNPTSVRGGAQYMMQYKFQLYQGNWWLSCNGQWVGYYPASLFKRDGLQTSADQVHFYGEIVDSASHHDATKTDMGSGYWPTSRWPWSAYMHNLRYQSTTSGSMSDYDADSIWATDSNEYDVEAHMLSGTSWGSYFWFGGPGAG